jgi:membrane protease YdiL (CAAX protease family)
MIEISLVFSILSPYLALSVVHGVARSFFAKSYHSPYTAMLLVVIADLFTALLIVPTSSSPYSFKLQSFSLLSGVLVGGVLHVLFYRPPPLKGAFPYSLGVWLAYSMVTAGLEEWVWRGHLMPHLADAFGNPLHGLFAQSVLFGFFHIGQGGFWVLCHSLIGIVFGVLVFFTGNLASSLVAHAVYNSLIFLHAAKHVKTR